MHGIESLEKKLDYALTKKKYWLNYLSKQDTKFGYLEKYPNLLACDKERATLNLYAKDSNNNYILKSKNGAFTGKNSGDKQTEGDLKTPIGVYELVNKRDSNLDPFYGPLAFVTSYPNVYDQFQGKDGHGIWIHGLPEDGDRDSFTKGCIAIDNSELKSLDKKVNIENTLLIIDDNAIKNNVSKETLATLLADLFKWRYAWLYNKLDMYLSFYAEDFRRYDGVQFSDFKRYKTRVFQKEEKKKIIFSDINVVPYPNLQDVYQISFEERYKSDSFQFSGNKTLMVRFLNNRMQIFMEK
jgi:murein L,D-transpeptidase YafK